MRDYTELEWYLNCTQIDSSQLIMWPVMASWKNFAVFRPHRWKHIQSPPCPDRLDVCCALVLFFCLFTDLALSHGPTYWPWARFFFLNFTAAGIWQELWNISVYILTGERIDPHTAFNSGCNLKSPCYVFRLVSDLSKWNKNTRTSVSRQHVIYIWSQT